MSLTKHFVDLKLQKSRHEEAKNNDLRRMLVTHNILAGHGRSEMNVDRLRRKRTEAAERRDLFADYTYTKASQDSERCTYVAEAEDRMADELSRRNAEAERIECDRRRICDGSEELRVLKNRLHGAQVNKERAQQLLEIERRREKQRRLDHQFAEHMENERLESIEVDYKVDIDKAKRRENCKKVNQKQIETKEAKRELAMHEHLKEKAEVQQVVDKILSEDYAEMVAKEEKRRESREMLLRFQIENAERQEAHEQEEIAEDNRIAKFANAKAEREEQLAREKMAGEKEKERILLSIIAAAEAKNKQAEELEQLRNDLHMEEHENKARLVEIRKKEKRDEDREMMNKAYVTQMDDKAQKKLEEKAEEHKMRDMLLARFAEDDRIDQMNNQKRRVRVEEHKREANRLIELHKANYEAAINSEKQGLQALRDEDARRHIVIEEERRKLLKEHAIPLMDFLPKGTFAHKTDYDIVFSARAPQPRITRLTSKVSGSMSAR